MKNFFKGLVVVAFLLTFIGTAEAEVKWLREAGAATLSADDTTAAQAFRGRAREAIVYIDVTVITTPDADDVVDLYVQTTYDNGTSWVDRANIQFVQGDNGNTAKRVVVFGDIGSADDIVTPTDGGLAANTDAAVPLGMSVRIKAVTTGATEPSYDYSASIFYRR